MLEKKHIPLTFSIVLGFVIFLLSMNFGMLWDNVLCASKMGIHLYVNRLFNWSMPDTFDPGHPPFLGFVLAIFWKVFGHSLWVSHLAILPFIIGTLYQLLRFVSYYIQDQKYFLLAILLLLADPTFTTSLVLVNPEVIILFFFFLAMNGILYQQNRWKFIGLFFLSIITFRSMMLFAGIFLFEIFNHRFIQRKAIKEIVKLKFLLFYMIASVPAILFVAWRLLTKGWLQTHPDSPWASLWHFPSLKEFFHNVVVLIWRYADFGRVFILFFLFVGLIYTIKKKLFDASMKQLLLLAFSSVSFVLLAVLFSTNAFGHRYFIISYVYLILVAFLIVQRLKVGKKLIYVSLFIGLITGNLWIYPEGRSQGWDATLAHIPYHSLRTQGITYLDDNRIDFKQVGTFFPNYNSQDEIDLNGDMRSLVHFNDQNPYVFYSNVYNISKDEIESLKKNYTEIKRFERFQIYVSILKKKEN